MKKTTKIVGEVLIAFLLLGIGIKFLYQYFMKMEEEESEHREPYQPEE
jgi:Tfp pilus assembly protein PilV